MIACCGPEMADQLVVDHRSKQLVRVDSLITVLPAESIPHFQAFVCGYVYQSSC
jgi:hypothetical protein